MKKTYIVFDLKDGKFVPHTHPVFTGEVAYDLPKEEQEIELSDGVRSFPGGEGQVIQALQDYARECPSDEFESAGTFYVLAVYSVTDRGIAAARKKTKSKITKK